MVETLFPPGITRQEHPGFRLLEPIPLGAPEKVFMENFKLDEYELKKKEEEGEGDEEDESKNRDEASVQETG